MDRFEMFGTLITLHINLLGKTTIYNIYISICSLIPRIQLRRMDEKSPVHCTPQHGCCPDSYLLCMKIFYLAWHQSSKVDRLCQWCPEWDRSARRRTGCSHLYCKQPSPCESRPDSREQCMAYYPSRTRTSNPKTFIQFVSPESSTLTTSSAC